MKHVAAAFAATLMTAFAAGKRPLPEGTSAAPSPPFWGPTWTAPFLQTLTLVPGIWVQQNNVTWYYDATTLPVGSSLYKHGEGQFDEICTGVAGHTKGNEECWLLASSDSWRYVIYPQTNECCRVCNVSDYCGIVSPSWLQDNSTYVGQATIEGMLCDGFLKVGGEHNYYYAEVGSGQPCLYYEGYPTLPDTSNCPWRESGLRWG